MEEEKKKGDERGDLSADPDRMHFDNIERHPLPEKKQTLENSGVDHRMIENIHDQPDEGENRPRNYNDNDIP